MTKDRKRKQAETGEIDPEEGTDSSKLGKKATEKQKKELAKTKAKAKAKAAAESKKALEKAKKKLLAETKAKEKAQKALERAQAKAKAKAQPQPKRSRKKKATPGEEQNDDASEAMQVEDPAPRNDADAQEAPANSDEAEEKQTFARRNRPSQHKPAARYDALKDVFNSKVKDKVKHPGGKEARSPQNVCLFFLYQKFQQRVPCGNDSTRDDSLYKNDIQLSPVLCQKSNR